jgi:hypothetical protein
MASGRLQIVDEGEVINGKPTIHLRGDLGQKATPPIGFWIDQTTNLPVRSEYQRGQSGEWGPPSDLTRRPPTEQNLAMLTAPSRTGSPNCRTENSRPPSRLMADELWVWIMPMVLAVHVVRS